jgi:hypothetical protein
MTEKYDYGSSTSWMPVQPSVTYLKTGDLKPTWKKKTSYSKYLLGICCSFWLNVLICITMFADVSLADKGHQESFSFSSSLALVNLSFTKGRPAHKEGCNLLQGGSKPDPGAERELLSNKVTACFGRRLWWVTHSLLYEQSYKKASWFLLSARDTNFFLVYHSLFNWKCMGPSNSGLQV